MKSDPPARSRGQRLGEADIGGLKLTVAWGWVCGAVRVLGGCVRTMPETPLCPQAQTGISCASNLKTPQLGASTTGGSARKTKSSLSNQTQALVGREAGVQPRPRPPSFPGCTAGPTQSRKSGVAPEGRQLGGLWELSFDLSGSGGVPHPASPMAVPEGTSEVTEPLEAQALIKLAQCAHGQDYSHLGAPPAPQLCGKQREGLFFLILCVWGGSISCKS